eukprot:1668817-Prymnesium_polylepis.1
MRHRRTRSAIRQCNAAAALIGFHLDSTSARARLASSLSVATPARNESSSRSPTTSFSPSHP